MPTYKTATQMATVTKNKDRRTILTNMVAQLEKIIKELEAEQK